MRQQQAEIDRQNMQVAWNKECELLRRKVLDLTAEIET
jgi:hypothetical protein